MFDPYVFLDSVCKEAYPKEVVIEEKTFSNRFTYWVQDLMMCRADGFEKGETDNTMPDLNEIVVTWALAGIDKAAIDYKGHTGMNMEVIVNSPLVRGLNAFHWALIKQLRSNTNIRLSALLGDVEEDETVGRSTRSGGRVYRVWGLTIDESVIGMNSLFIDSENSGE